MNRRPVSTRQGIAGYRLLHPYATLVSTHFGRRAGRLIPLCAGAIALVVLSAQAQPPPPPGLPEGLPDIEELRTPPLPLGTPESEAPVWLLWREFHHRLTSPRSLSLTHMETMQTRLVERYGLTGNDVNVILITGSVYLDELALIQDQAREEISEYKSRFMPDERLHGPLLASMRSKFNVDPSDWMPGRTPDGRLVREVLAAEGFFDRREQRRKSAFRAHWESLAASIGLRKLVWLERIIEREIAGSVVRGTRARRVPAPRPVPRERIAPTRERIAPR